MVTDGESWVTRTLRRMRSAGCDPLLAVVGAAAAEVRALLSDDVMVVENAGWAEGLGSSLRAGLVAAADLPPAVDAALLMLVDLPGVTGDELRRFLTEFSDPRGAALGQAGYDGVPGHPVLLGRDHWAAVAAAVHGDVGARAYLAEHGATVVRLGPAAVGADRDRPEAPAD